MHKALEGRAVSLAIPARAEYVSLARLAAAAVCRLTSLSDDEVADVKLAVDEAANTWIGPPAHPGARRPDNVLSFRYVLDVTHLLLEISCPGPRALSDEERELGRAILEETVDECYLEPGSVKLVKYLPAPAQ